MLVLRTGPACSSKPVLSISTSCLTSTRSESTLHCVMAPTFRDRVQKFRLCNVATCVESMKLFTIIVGWAFQTHALGMQIHGCFDSSSGILGTCLCFESVGSPKNTQINP